jgi:hypothetical protein
VTLVAQETTNQTGLPDLPTWAQSARAEAAQADFSIDDYGRAESSINRPFQVIQPAYGAPRFLKRFTYLGEALRECKTLCHLEGRPFRVVRRERVGSGARRGGVPCKTCGPPKLLSKFPAPVSSGCLHGYPDAKPVAEVRPGGQAVVFDKCGRGRLVGRPNYTVSHTPFPREYHPGPLQQRYVEAVKTGQLLARRTGRRAYICSDFGAKCEGRNPKHWVPVVYVEPGGLAKRYPNIPTGTTITNGVSPSHLRELIAQSRGATFLGQGH